MNRHVLLAETSERCETSVDRSTAKLKDFRRMFYALIRAETAAACSDDEAAAAATKVSRRRGDK
jgi:hypothetical protein